MTDTPARPTQVSRPWRTTARTAIQAALASLPLIPIAAQAFEIDAWPIVASITAGAASLTRLMADPRVDAWLTRYAPFLSASPDTPGRHRRANHD
ncbi:hypothetical protein [Tomitella biformata]|uniref:hypothetical protein n=1 Tax=Tomitella biformata TaxID=630403 RepID=UPI0004673185|nr:hypothetical protein [Tomitella biformata]